MKINEQRIEKLLEEMRIHGTRKSTYAYDVFKTLFEEWRKLKTGAKLAVELNVQAAIEEMEKERKRLKSLLSDDPHRTPYMHGKSVAMREAISILRKHMKNKNEKL